MRPSDSLRFREPHLVLADGASRRFGLRLGQRQRRASTWHRPAARGPGLPNAIPSSTFTSTTLPVIFDETVARRRAVTYPDAFSTAAWVPAARSETVATSTSTGRSRVNQRQPPAPAAASTSSSTTQPIQRPAPGRSRFALDAQRRQFVLEIRHVDGLVAFRRWQSTDDKTGVRPRPDSHLEQDGQRRESR